MATYTTRETITRRREWIVPGDFARLFPGDEDIVIAVTAETTQAAAVSGSVAARAQDGDQP